MEPIQLGGPHYKICECDCGAEFYGRRNQKYFDPSHKSKVNNAKRDKRNEKFKPWFDEMIISYRALQIGIKNVDKDNWVYIGKLTKLGFDPEVATKGLTGKDGNRYKHILDLAFRLSDDKKYVQIFKYK